MRFVTFQPYDWKTSKRKDGWHDIYWDKLGFDPVWCIPAESLEQALVNGLLAYPVTPEQAIFFKANDFYMVPKLEHCNYLVTKKPDNRSVLLSSEGLKEYLKMNNAHVGVSKFLSEMSPYKFEYLVSPDAMNITAEIDIDKCMQETLFNEEYCDCRKEAEGCIAQQTEKAKTEFRTTPQPDWFTEERCIRNAVAKLKWGWYVQDNDFFIDDYKKIFGMRNGDADVTTEKINLYHLDSLVNLFNMVPSEENLNAVIDYLDSVMYVEV